MRIIKEDEKKKKTKWTTLNADEKKNLWRSIDFDELFSGTVLTSEVEIWKSSTTIWLTIIDYLDCDHKNCLCSLNSNNFMENVKSLIWHIRVIKAKCVTPYLHVMMFHVTKMLEKFENIKQFNTSAQELKNYVQTMQQFRGSNQQNTPSSLTSHQSLSCWFMSLHCVNTPVKRKNFKKIDYSSLLPDIGDNTETFPIPVPD